MVSGGANFGGDLFDHSRWNSRGGSLGFECHGGLEEEARVGD
jgi:hypothetical protein